MKTQIEKNMDDLLSMLQGLTQRVIAIEKKLNLQWDDYLK